MFRTYKEVLVYIHLKSLHTVTPVKIYSRRNGLMHVRWLFKYTVSHILKKNNRMQFQYFTSYTSTFKRLKLKDRQLMNKESFLTFIRRSLRLVLDEIYHWALWMIRLVYLSIIFTSFLIIARTIKSTYTDTQPRLPTSTFGTDLFNKWCRQCIAKRHKATTWCCRARQ